MSHSASLVLARHADRALLQQLCHRVVAAAVPRLDPKLTLPLAAPRGRPARLHSAAGAGGVHSAAKQKRGAARFPSPHATGAGTGGAAVDLFLEAGGAVTDECIKKLEMLIRERWVSVLEHPLGFKFPMDTSHSRVSEVCYLLSAGTQRARRCPAFGAAMPRPHAFAGWLPRLPSLTARPRPALPPTAAVRSCPGEVDQTTVAR